MVKLKLRRHLHKFVDAYVDGSNRYDLKKEKDSFMNSKKMKDFFLHFEERKKRCEILMQYDNDFDVYKRMTTEEISDFM